MAVTGGYGVKGFDLQITIASSLTSVGQLVTIDPPGYKIGKRDTTTLASTAKQYEQTIADPQEISGTLIYDPTNPAVGYLQTWAITPVAGGVACKIVASTTTKAWTFNAQLSNFSFKGGGVEDTLMAEISLQPTGSLTFPTTT